MEVLRRIAAPILDLGTRLDEKARLKYYDAFVSEFAYIAFPFSSSKVIRYGPRCSPHECFQLYAQQTNVYCAVATGQMILDFYRRYFTQDQIAAAMGTDSGGTGNPGQVAGYESLSNNCLDATYDTSAAWSEAKSEIDANRPLKSGIPGHARACAGWMKTWSWSSFSYDLSLKIYDPWPWNADICAGGAVVWEDWDAVTHTNFIYVRHVERRAGNGPRARAAARAAGRRCSRRGPRRSSASRCSSTTWRAHRPTGSFPSSASTGRSASCA